MPDYVICMKWGAQFGPDYVNVLHGAVSDHLSRPFTFLCLTDDARGLRPGIEVLPLPEIGLAPEDWYTPGVWPKLGLFGPDLDGLTGRALFLDLDTMVIGPLARFFEVEGGMVLLDTGPGWRRSPRPGPAQPSTGVFTFDIGRQGQIAEAFMRDKAANMARFRNEQDFVAAHGRDVRLWPPGWVISFKRHVARRGGLDLVLPPPAPSGPASIIAFHGTPRPVDLIRPGIWGRFPHVGRGAIGWVRDYWERYGA